jgi:hypothetical protein
LKTIAGLLIKKSVPIETFPEKFLKISGILFIQYPASNVPGNSDSLKNSKKSVPPSTKIP